MKRLLYLFLVLILASCLQDNNSGQQPGVTVQDGYLVFKDKASFETISNQLKDKSSSYLDGWEKKQIGFESQRSIYNRVIDEELKAAESNSDQHSSYYTANQNIFEIDEEGSIDYNLPKTNEFYHAFVNKDGLYKVGSSLIQVKKEKIIEVLDGDVAKLKGCEKLTASDKENGVLITTIKTITLPLENFGRVAFEGDASCKGYTGGGGQRVDGRIFYSASGTLDLYGSLGCAGCWIWRHTVTTEAVNWKKNIGWNKKPTAQLRIVGTVFFDGIWGGTVYIDQGTNGNTETTIRVKLFDSGWVINGPYPVPPYSGDLTFYGRDGTSCSI